MKKAIFQMTKEEILATMNPAEILNALIDEPDSLLMEDTPIKQAMRALSPEQQNMANKALLARHERVGQEWRQRNGLPHYVSRFAPLFGGKKC